MHLTGTKNGRTSTTTTQKKKASIVLTALLFVLFFAFLTLSFGPWLGSQATKIPLALESPLSSYLGAATQPNTNGGGDAAASSNSGSVFFYVGASTSLPSSEQNTGVRSLIQVRSQNVSDGVLSFWISEAMSNNMWAQAGYYIDNGSAPIAFYQIWNLTDRTEVTTGTEPVTLGTHIFSIASLEGTDSWNFSLDGRTFGTYDMGTNVSSATYPIYAMSEEGYTRTPFSFEPVLFQSAIQVFRSDSWNNASSATSYGSDWGLVGHAQDSLLGNNEFRVGSGYGELAANSALWL